jgi:two-component system NtrC family sensor kinase
VKCYGALPPIRGDSKALERLFTELLVNAVDALPLSTADTNEIRVVTRVAVGAQGPELVVEIQDSGAGIPAEVAAQVFDPSSPRSR